MSGLAEFLEARIAEDKAAAIRSMPGPWGVIDDRGTDASNHSIWSHGGGYDITQMVINRPTAEHIARWDPSRVLAECEARRRIVEEHGGRAPFHADPCDAHDASGHTIPCDTLRFLAAPFSDHPDYDPSWRV